jgi:hypothetical protein
MLSSLDALDWGDVSSRAAAAAASVTRSQQVPFNRVTSSGTTSAATATAAAATKVRAKGMGSGLFSFWPGAAAAAALDTSSFVNVVSATTLNDCLWACSMTNMCAGVVFGGFDAATDNIGRIYGTETRCQKVMGQSDVSPQRTLLRAKYTALSPAP